jgi:hypothetical protein
MSPLNDNLADYLRLRRQLGFELKRAGQELASFVAFLEQVGADRITIELALQISELMAVAGALRPALKAATYRTVIGLLAATGIRIGEALGLDREDVSLDDGVLRLRVAKQGQLSNVVDLAMKNDQAATLSCVIPSSSLSWSVTLMPSLNVTPSSTSVTSSWPLNRRQRSCADSSSL